MISTQFSVSVTSLRIDSRINTSQHTWPTIKIGIYFFFEGLCCEVERRTYSSDSDTLQEFLLRLQSERIIGASLALKVNPSVLANVQGNI